MRKILFIVMMMIGFISTSKAQNETTQWYEANSFAMKQADIYR